MVVLARQALQPIKRHRIVEVIFINAGNDTFGRS
jgi:hypothetical protein